MILCSEFVKNNRSTEINNILMRFYIIAASFVILTFGCKVKQSNTTVQDNAVEVENTVENPEVVGLMPLEYPEYRASRTRLMDLLHTKLEISL